MNPKEYAKTFLRFRDAQRLRREMHSRLNSKGSITSIPLAKSLQEKILNRALAECTGQIACKYPPWMERQMMVFTLWKNQFVLPTRLAKGRWNGSHFVSRERM